MDRFSKENMERLVKRPSKGANWQGYAVDYIGLVLLILAFIFFKLFNIQGLIPNLIVVSLAIFQGIFFYLEFIEFYKIKVKHYRIDIGLNREASFIFFSDIHVGYEYSSTGAKRLDTLIKIVNNLNIDTVLIGGDFLTRKLDKDLLIKFKDLKAKTKIGIYGNHDADYLEPNVEYNVPTEFIEAIEQANIKMLVNDCVNLIIDGSEICVGGIPDLYSKNFNIITAFENAAQNSRKILLSHNPDIIDFVEESDNIDLILSGHNHAGQIYLPIKGAILPMPTKRNWLTKGIYQINKKTQLFLSCGVGFSGTRVRFNAQPEVCVITLT